MQHYFWTIFYCEIRDSSEPVSLTWLSMHRLCSIRYIFFLEKLISSLNLNI